MKETHVVKFIIPAQAAKAGPPVGPMLGQYHVNIIEFCTKFNNLTMNYELGYPLKTIILIMNTNEFQIKILTPPLKFLLYIYKDSTNSINLSNIYKIYKILITSNLEGYKETHAKNLFSCIKTLSLKIDYDC